MVGILKIDGTTYTRQTGVCNMINNKRRGQIFYRCDILKIDDTTYTRQTGVCNMINNKSQEQIFYRCSIFIQNIVF